MAGGGDVEDDVAVALALEDVEDSAAEDAAVDGDGFAGFEPDLKLIVGLDSLDEFDESLGGRSRVW